MKQKTIRRNDNLPEILHLRKSGYKVEPLTGYQFRINSRLDVFPTNQRFHNIKTGKRGSYNSGKLIDTVKEQLTAN